MERVHPIPTRRILGFNLRSSEITPTLLTAILSLLAFHHGRKSWTWCPHVDAFLRTKKNIELSRQLLSIILSTKATMINFDVTGRLKTIRVSNIHLWLHRNRWVRTSTNQDQRYMTWQNLEQVFSKLERQHRWQPLYMLQWYDGTRTLWKKKSVHAVSDSSTKKSASFCIS